MLYLIGFLVQIIFYSAMWLIDDYLGLLMCLIMVFIVGGLLIFAIIAELIEKSKVPKSYFKWMILSAIAPALVVIFFSVLFEGNFDWIDQFG